MMQPGQPRIVLDSAIPPVGEVLFAPVDRTGAIGELNSFVMESQDISPNRFSQWEELEQGFAVVDGPRSKVILVVTIEGRPTGDALRENLTAALVACQELRPRATS